MKSVRLGILILAYRSHDVVERLLEFWNGCEIFLHVDKKVDIGRFHRLCRNPGVQTIEKRFEVYWGGWNMVLAELELVKAALAAKCDRLILLSDDSFPLRRRQELESTFREDSSHIGMFLVDKKRPAWERYLNFYYVDCLATGYRSPDILKRFITEKDVEQIRELHNIQIRGKIGLEQLFMGPQWWCLTAEAAKYVISVHESNEHLRNSFRFSLIPDEHYIQTIIGLGNNSANKRFRLSPPFMWTVIDRKPSPWLFTDVSELTEAFNSIRLFVRKVSPGLASQLLQRLS